MLTMSEIMDGIGPSKLSPMPAASDRNDEPPDGWLCGEPTPELDGAFCTLPDPPAPATTPPRASAEARPSSAEDTPANSEANSLEIKSEEIDRSIPQFHASMGDLEYRDRRDLTGCGKPCALSYLGLSENSRNVL